MTTPSQFSVFLPTSFYISQDFEQSWIKIQSTITDISLKTNLRQIGLYNGFENPTGQEWFKNTVGGIPRQALRKVYTFGVIVAGATLNIPHLIPASTNLTFTNIYGTIKTVVPDDRPLPYVDAAVVTNQVSVNRNGVNIVITNGATAPDIVSGIVVLEYLKN